MALHAATECYAEPGRNSIIDTINPATGLTHMFGETADQVQARYPRAERLTLEAWRAGVIARQTTPIVWLPSTMSEYHEMLNVLPPALWVGGAFLVGEPMDTDAATGAERFAGYLHRGPATEDWPGDFFVASRPITRAELRAELARVVGR